MDWKQIHAEAWQRTRQSGFLEWKRLSTSVGVPLIVGLIQGYEGVSPPLNIAITLSSGLLLYGLLVLIERWVRIREVIATRIDVQDRAIQQKDKKIADLTAPKPNEGLYSERQLTKLARLKYDGRPMLEYHISPNQSQPTARQEVETLDKKHQNWRNEILEILNDKDATIFEALVEFNNSNFQIPGVQAPYNLDHARLRNQLLGELGRLEEILIRAHRSGV